MTEPLQALVESLREELKLYGELLGLLDRQQDLVVKRGAEELLQTVSQVNYVSSNIVAARACRERRRRDLAARLRLDERVSFRELMGQIPSDYRPLVRALVEENNALLVQVRQRARQNHQLLHHSLELMQRLMTTLFPSRQPATYNGAGSLLRPGLSARAIYDAVG